MAERYDLKKILEEIAEDEAIEKERPSDRRISQEYIKKLLAQKKKRGAG